jgi:hypothetical protein
MMIAFRVVGCVGNVRIQHSGHRHRSASVSRIGLIVVASAGVILLDCASAEPIMTSSAAARIMTAVRKKRRRSWFISSDIYLSPMPSANCLSIQLRM